PTEGAPDAALPSGAPSRPDRDLRPVGNVKSLYSCTKVLVPRHARPRRWSLEGVMSLWKLRVGAESYYLAQIASGLDEYYTGAGEAPGQWSGTGADLLGLSGQVEGDDLRSVLAGLAPGT